MLLCCNIPTKKKRFYECKKFKGSNMRIVVNDIAATYGGGLSILQQFYQYVIEHDKDNEWIFLLGDRYLEETENVKIRCLQEIKKSHIKKVVFDCITGQKYIEKLKPDVVISMQNIITFGLKCPQVLYVHQSIPFQRIKKFSFFKKEERPIALVQYVIGGFIKASVRKATAVVVQTNWMKRAVEEVTGIENEKLSVCFPKVTIFPRNNSAFQKNIFFYPTNCEIYKNIDLIVEACKKLNKEGIRDFEVHITQPEGAVVHPNIRCIGFLNKEQMQSEYQGGTLVFPSYIETVGLPLLEARSCNTMILASDTPFAHECLDGYNNISFFSPFSVNELKEKMKEILSGTIDIRDDSDKALVSPSWEEFYQLILSFERK